MKATTQYLILLSFDCLSSHDIPILEELPNFRRLMQTGTTCKNVETIYPSLTYPCHTSIVTGNYPKRHGITSNTLLQPGKSSPDWYWHRHHIEGTTLYDEAKKAGLKTAAFLWPVTAKGDIDYHMPEIFANRSYHHQIPVSLFNGSFFYQLEMNRRFGKLRKGLQQPHLDDFVLESAAYTIKAKKPNLMLVHFTDLDTQRHYHGVSSNEAKAALRRHDERLGKILEAVEVSGLKEQTTIAALGDHSALDECKAVKPNTILKEMGLLEVNAKGNVSNWAAYCKSCDGSAYIYAKNDDSRLDSRLLEHFKVLSQDGSNGIERVLTREEASEKGADPNASLMLEASLGFYFSESYEGDYIDTITQKDVDSKKYTWASHGYSPDKPDYQTVLILSGSGIAKNKILPSMRLVDEGPTFARLLGLNLGETDGTVQEGFFI
ncbi:alkaline phosphatase family protein [Bacillus massilinigeriensis]|uniref:alkaline phosphatase family protein n=1 Tax=Bacillus mediterraneensis TaxID=1805474 RepID=UPI0008F8C2AE|nr:ectonucleotide pyrophosphatase/phosphodiesterase [Bacillus mediterraneensis]